MTGGQSSHALHAARVLISALLLAPAIVLGNNGDAGNRSHLCVTVVDPQGLPVDSDSATVTLEPLAAAAVETGPTRGGGRWCTEVAPGTYVVRATGRGLEGAASLITVRRGGDVHEIELRLRLSSIATQVEVTASRLPESLWDAPLPVRQADARVLRAIGARQLNDALQEIPEVVTFAGGVHSGGGSANVQGFASRDVEILLDGQPLFGRVNGYVDLNQFDSSIIEAIEIKTGASAMTYGLQGMGGAIHLVTRRAEAGRHGAFESGYGSFNTGLLRAEVGYAARGFALLGIGAAQRGLGYHLDPAAVGKTQPANRVRNLFQSLYLPAWRGWNAAATFLFVDQNFWGADGSPATGVYDFRRPKRRAILLPRATYTLSGSSLLAVRGRRIYYRSDEDVVYREPLAIRAQKTENTAEGGDVEWSFARADGFQLSTGAYFNHHRMIGDRLTSDGNRASTSVWSQLTAAEVPLAPGLRLLAGYRADRDRLFGARLSPQAALAWRPAEWLSFSGGATRGVRAPDFNEMYVFHTHAGGRVRIYGEPRLRPQRSWSFHAGTSFQPLAQVRLEARLFHHDLTDLIEARFEGVQGMASVYRYANVGRARIRGGTVNVHCHPSRRLELTTGYQLLDSADLYRGGPLAYAPRHRGHVRLSFAEPRRGLLLSYFANLTSATYFGASGGLPIYMRGFELMGLNAEKELRRGVSLRVTLRNLTGDVDPAYRLTAPRSVEASLRWRFGGRER